MSFLERHMTPRGTVDDLSWQRARMQQQPVSLQRASASALAAVALP